MIYTAITGGKDKPRDDIVCFTAYNRFKEPALNSKIYKVLSHLYDPDEYSIWIDGNLFLKKPFEDYIKLLGRRDIAVFRNPYRDCLYDEARYCLRHNIGHPSWINKQILRYKLEKVPKNLGLGACFLIIRRHTEQIKRLNEKWWAEICAGSLRDQISFPYVFGKIVKYLPKVHPFNNLYFRRVGHDKHCRSN